MDSIFTVGNEDLQRLSPGGAVDFFRELLWAEATNVGIAKNLINVPSAITCADGGIDAEVQGTGIAAAGQGIIKQGLTRYQIKTGSFSPSSDGDIKSVLFREGTNELKPRVKSCIDRGGTLIIVLFGWDNPETADDQHINKFKEKLTLIDAKYQDAKIEIWGQNKLKSFLKPFPSLVLDLKRISSLPFQTHKSWSQNKDMQQTLIKSTDFDQKAGAIQELLRSPEGARHIRVIDEAGGGKTRFVLEATNTDDLAPLVLYTRATKFIDSGFMYLILRDDNPFNVILVLDECTQHQRIEIWNHLANRGPRIKLITINNEPDSKDHGIDYCEIPALKYDDIKKIILTYGIPHDHVNRWASLAGTSPRFAHMIAINLKYFPDDILRPVEGVYDRIIAGYEDPTSEEVKKRKRVLTHIALFKRFGYKKPVEEEAKAVCRLLQKVDTTITWGKFQEIIDKLLSQNILQGETTLYITPKAFHIRMWIEWWDIYGSSFDLGEFLADIPDKIQTREWFYEMFEYAAESGAATKVVRELLGPGGPFKDFEYFKTKLGGRFFLALTNADPESALCSLKRTIGKQTKDQLLAFTLGRRDVVWSLERIAVWRSLFADAARLLLALAEAENEMYANNATGVFTGLFSPGPGKVAPTEASPQERIVVLKEALNSPSKQKRLIAIKAGDNALETANFTRMVGAEYQGLRKEPNLWMPRTYAELFDAYSQVWHLLTEKLETLEADERTEVINVLLNNSRGLLLYHSLADIVIAALVELSQKDYTDKKQILSTVVEILHYNGKALNKSTREALEQFRDTLTGSGFSAMMKRYVGMDLLQDQFDEEGEHEDKVGPRIGELAGQAVKDKCLAQQEFPWLVTTEAQNGYRFGYELGKRDVRFTLLPSLLDAQRGASVNSSVYFLGGYFRAIFEKDKNMWEDQLDALAKDGKLDSFDRN